MQAATIETPESTPDRSKKFTITLPERHDAQRKVVDEAKRFNVLVCGRRWGKTTLGIDRLIHPALSGKPVAWFAPNYKSLAEPWRECVRILGGELTKRTNMTERRIELATGGSVDFWSLDSPDVAESVRGRKYACVVVDEAATIKDLLGIWDAIIRPTLVDLLGEAWFLSTPRGYNGFKTLHDRGGDPERPEWASWQMPTSTNPHIWPEEIEDARRDMTEASFSQEFLAQFISWEGSVFRGILESAKAKPYPGRWRDSMGIHKYCIGVDWGRSVDYTVFVVIDLFTRSMVAMERSNQVDYSVQRQRLQILRDRWQPVMIRAEMNSIGQPIIEQLLKDGIKVEPFLTTNATKNAAIEALALALERQDLLILPDPVLIAELQAYQSEVLPSGLTRYGAPSGSHDDCVMALAIAWTCATESIKRMNYRVFRSEFLG